MNKTEEKLNDIKNNPDKHRHEFGALYACCVVDGILDTMLTVQ